jgi:polysaccharide export outer membrane protein
MNKNENTRFLLFIFFSLFFSLFFFSCRTYKDIPYFQDLEKQNISIVNIDNFSSFEFQSGDIIAISISSLNPEASAIFNTNLNRISGNNFDTSPTNPVYGYLVDNMGQIHLPLLGSIKVEGLNSEQLRRLLTTELLEYLNEPVVNVRVLNFKISVLGDVAKPGTFDVSNERITITEALSLAGDLETTAMRKNVILVREYRGLRMFIPIDLRSKEIFESPYFYLKNNDLIYVEPSRDKYAKVNPRYQNTAIFLSALTIVAIVFSTIYRP